jgi:NADH-quinone oxidoreductase subunit I
MPVKNAVEGLAAMLKGMSITFKYLFETPITIQYPDEKRKASSLFKGRHYLRLWQDGMERCIACHLCEIVCPANAIYVKDAPNPKVNPISKSPRYAADFQINMLRCIFVGDCEEVCPVDCIVLSDEYEISGYTREEMIYTKEILVEKHPGASGRDPMVKRGDGRME